MTSTAQHENACFVLAVTEFGALRNGVLIGLRFVDPPSSDRQRPPIARQRTYLRSPSLTPTILVTASLVEVPGPMT
jgi:hypothetical protein